MQQLGKVMIGMAVILALIGGLLLLAGRFQWPRLPGDVLVKRENFTFYFPIGTSIILSVLVSVVLYLIRRWSQ